MKISPENALAQLAQSDSPFLKLFEHGTLVLEIYRPEKIDRQTPHTRDEVYIIISGSGEFQNGSERVQFSAGDFLFVPAGTEHRFENFTEDFSTWVLFYGPEGGERNA